MSAHPPSPAAHGTSDFDPRLERYLDGMLHGEELIAFERDLAASPALRAQIELQQSIDSAIRAEYSYHPSADVVGRIGPSSGADGVSAVVGGRARVVGAGEDADRSPIAGRLRFYSMAAVIVLGLAGTWAAYVHMTTPTFQKDISPAQLYANIAPNPVPEFVCKDDAEFAAMVKEKLGQPLLLASTADLTALGWAYSDTYEGRIVSDKTMVLMTRLRGEVVLVLIDRASRDRELDFKPGGNFNLFKRTIGKLVVYEITPFDKPEVMFRLYDPRENTKPAP